MLALEEQLPLLLYSYVIFFSQFALAKVAEELSGIGTDELLVWADCSVAAAKISEELSGFSTDELLVVADCSAAAASETVP